MTDQPAFSCVGLFRYPVKGLPPQSLSDMRLEAGRPVPFDRHWAFQRKPPTEEEPPGTWKPRRNFLQVAQDHILARLPLTWDGGASPSPVLNGQSFDLAEPNAGARLWQAVVAKEPELDRDPPPVFQVARENHVDADGQAFADNPNPFVSIINRQSLADMGHATSETLEPVRFRMNILIDGPAWGEWGLVGKRIRIGNCELAVEERIGRCKAITVDPATGEPGADLPRQMRKQFGHADCGIYARVLRGGTITINDTLQGV